MKKYAQVVAPTLVLIVAGIIAALCGQIMVGAFCFFSAMLCGGIATYIIWEDRKDDK